MILEIFAAATLVLAVFPAAMTLVNLLLYRPPMLRAGRERPSVSVLIPARDEEATIRGAVQAALASRGVELEVIVLDDQSRDRTAAIVREIAKSDGRVRLELAPPLPDGWCGKQHACYRLAGLARNPVLLFIDADTRLERDGLASLVDEMQRTSVALLSGVPRELTGTWAEKLVVPMIHFILLGYLPILGVRRSRLPVYGAGCGQLMLVNADDYRRAGGHAEIRDSRHDGLTLPRAFRLAGFRTDLVDATRVARCRMYQGASEVWRGFAKNATEGMATPAGILPWSVLLLGGSVLPWVFLLPSIGGGATPTAFTYFAIAALLGLVTRLALAFRFDQSWLGALLHPIGTLLVVGI
jgi:hypothetical protein